ncbi:hypothetical protein NUW58_g8689 [Xylaria curta]|uniref:Uncharacterized protein n=1 Tax=Xylaria curta TaxID=42375 RepID=A0ACC1N519_9PEZI|nr:hypothetical protein NUW58_g8689 [Xylaria curta]
MLSRVLTVAPGSRPFVNDLTPQSGMLQAINEEFPRYCQELQLFSFYETQSMYYGLGKGLIVEKQCAVMNYPNERRTYLDANHRDVARFSTPGEPSYILVRNALATTIESHRALLRPQEKEFEHAELEALCRFLGVFGPPEDDLITNESQKLPGSCQWIIQRDSFQQWRDALTSKVFWLCGRPGAGKSVLASHIISHLRALNLDCCYFFFTDGDKSKATINSLLRSMSWQMAVIHPEIFTTIANVANSWKDPPIDKVDHIPVWSRIFATAISKVRLKKPQYWVIDALDECKNGQELMNFLRKIQEMWPLCILVTSRTGVDPYLNTTNPSMEVISETLSEDNKSDIACFLSANLHHLPGATTSAQQDISDRILRNSRGCFLWVNLVLRELRQVHTAAEISQVLDNNPSDMNALYTRILDEMSHAKFGKDLAKAILTWTTCAFRPLSVDEIHFAIEKDIQDSIDDITKSVSTCSNLVFIDKANKVQLIHLTAREFLTRKDITSEFIIDRAQAHKRLALVCIQTLCGEQGGSKKGSRHRRLANEMTSNTDSAFYDYASTYLFQHILQARSTDNEIFIELAKFLTSREILVWIERLAKQSDLQRLYQAGKNCTSLVTRRAHQTPPIGIQKQLSLVERWGIDLVRLVNKFGKRLNQSPSAIHYLIPPFCPTETAFQNQFVSAYRGLNVHGCVSKNWDDRLCTINYARPFKPMDIVSSGNRTALALSNGTVVVYDNATLLETNTLLHQEPVWSISFSENGSLLASGGAKTVRVWNLESSEQLICFRVPAVSMLISFIEDDEMLLVVAKNNLVIYWDIANNVPRGEPIDWTRDLHENDPQLHARRPTMAAFSAEQGLLAIIYRGEDILLWTLDGEQIYDMYEKDNGSSRFESTKLADGATTVWAIAFSSTLESNLLVAAYSDGDVVIYDTDSGEPRGSLDGINAQTIACSPDGRTLATADSQGNISLFDLRTLKFIYRLRFDTDAVRTKKLAFTSDNLRLLDIRGRQFSVWDPTVLLRQEFEDENSDTISCSTVAQDVEADTGEGLAITAMVCMRDAPRVICGKEDGVVDIYNIAAEPYYQELFTQTRNCAITLLHFDDESNILTCGDASGRVTTRRLIREGPGSWAAGEILFDKRNLSSITQIIASMKHNRLLISTLQLDTLWNLVDTSAADYVACVQGNAKPRWFASPMSEDLLIRFHDATATFYAWESLAPISSVELGLHGNVPLNIESVLPLQHPQYFATVQIPSSNEPRSTRVYHLWDLRDFLSKARLSSAPEEPRDKVNSVLDFGQLEMKVETVIGVANERAVFLDPDNWVCSADIIPSFRPGVAPAVGAKAQSGEIVFVKRTDVAVIRRGLEITDKGVFSGSRTPF